MARLRPYQQTGIEEIFHHFQSGNHNIILYSATGSGKSEMAAFLAMDCLKNNFPCVFIVRGRELVKNLSNRLSKYQIDHSVYMAGHPRLDKSKLIQVCSIDTLSSRSNFPYSDEECLLILDEQHRDYTKVFENYKKSFIVGMSGTPFNDKMNQHYHAVVNPIEGYELRDAGVLVHDKHYCPHIMDTSNIKIVAGDFHKKQLESLVTESRIVGDIVSDYKERALGRPAVCFAFSVKHSQILTEAFNKEGIKAIHVDAKSSEQLKDYAKKALEDGSINVVCNVDIFSIGWDCPAVSCVILARPTWSLIWYLQAIGRGLRSFPGKTDCIILDSAGNVFRHGTAYEIRSVSLDKKPEKKYYVIKDNIKNCEMCFYIIPSTTIECPACGHIHKQKVRDVKNIEGVLAEYMETSSQKEQRLIKECYAYYLKLYYVKKSRGLSEEWIFDNIDKKFPRDVIVKALSKKTTLPSRFDKALGV